MKLRTLATFAAIGAFLFGAGAAIAHDTSFPTGISFEGSDQNGDTYLVFGYVSSPKQACVPGRKVKVHVVHQDDSRTLADVDTTSSRGTWAAELTLGPGDTFGQVKVIRKNVGPNGHRHVCDSVGLSILD